MAEEHFNLLISQITEMNTNKFINVDVDGILKLNSVARKDVKPDSDSKHKGFFYNDIDLVSTDGIRLATLKNNIIVTVQAEDKDGNKVCFATYQFKVTCHGWTAKIPIYMTLLDEHGEVIKKIPLKPLEVYSGYNNVEDTRVEFFEPEHFDKVNNVIRGGDNSRWLKSES